MKRMMKKIQNRSSIIFLRKLLKINYRSITLIQIDLTSVIMLVVSSLLRRNLDNKYFLFQIGKLAD